MDRELVETTRKMIAAHLAAGRAVAELPIERMKPPVQNMLFEFVGNTPPAPIRDQWYRCSYCERNLQFRAGRIVLCADQLLRLIGEDCWVKHIENATWKAAKQDWAYYQKREAFNAIRAPLQRELATFGADLRVTIQARGNVFRTYQNIGAVMRRQMQPLCDRLDRARRLGGNLTVERVLSSRQLELRRDASRGQAVSQFEIVSLHRMQGLAILDEHDVADDAIAVLPLIYEAAATLRDNHWERFTLRALNHQTTELYAKIRTVADAVTQANAVLRHLRSFYSGENLQGLQAWSEDPDCDLCLDGSLSVTPTAIIFEDNAGRRGEILRPDSSAIEPWPDASSLLDLVKRGSA